MTLFKQHGQLVFALVVILPLFGGCSHENPELVGLRNKLLMRSEPSDATTIAAANDTVAENPNVSIVARVVADEHEAFVKGQAAFLVTELASEGESHCTDESCPFCKNKQAECSTAAIQFVSDAGKPLAIDARDLFGLRPGDTVIVQGTGKAMEGLDMLQVTAEEMFVRARTTQ